MRTQFSLENVKGTDHFRDLSIKEGSAQIDVQEMPCVCVCVCVCVCGLDCSGSVYVSAAETNAVMSF
jgi:hypothetical protein